MRRRALALMLGLLVAGAPEVLALCQFSCATPLVAKADAEGHHEHSHPSPGSAQETTKASSHGCGNADGLAAAVMSKVRITPPPADVATIFTTVPPGEGAAPISCGLRQTPPGNRLLATPLRV
jgi:hypothetical protein